MERKRVGLIVDYSGGGDHVFSIVSEEDYKVIIEYHPTQKALYGGIKQDIFDEGKYLEFVGNYFYDIEKDDCNDKVLIRCFGQYFVPEKIDLSEYNIIGILTLPIH